MTTMTERFRSDNTEGYTDEQLAELNRRFVEAAGDLIDQDDADLMVGSALDRVAEQVQAEFDVGA